MTIARITLWNPVDGLALGPGGRRKKAPGRGSHLPRASLVPSASFPDGRKLESFLVRMSTKEAATKVQAMERGRKARKQAAEIAWRAG